MNGVHDVGGMHGFGPIVREEHEPVYHAPWEGRIQSLMDATGPLRSSVHGMRFAIESVEPVRQLAASYWERWLAAIELMVLANGLATREELRERLEHFVAHPDAPTSSQVRSRRARRGSGAGGTALPDPKGSAVREATPPRFAVGDTVQTRRMNPEGHTRLARYVRGRRGQIARVCPPAGLPDNVVAGRDPRPQAVYAVQFEARELWGAEAHAHDSICLDIWDDYLEPAGGAASITSAADGDGEASVLAGTPPYPLAGAGGPWWATKDGASLPPPDALTKTVESVLVEHGLADSAVIDAEVEARVRQFSATPPPGARLMARAWLDDSFRQRLLADANGAAEELGIHWGQRTVVLENTRRVHNALVCTLCSCMSPLAGLKPTWFKSLAYRSRAVLEPRAVLREFGLAVDDGVRVQVWDTSAEHRYLVLPRRPANTEALVEEELAALVTTETMLGVAEPHAR